MKRVSYFICVVLVFSLVAAGSTMAKDRIFFGIATGGTGGTYYPLGGMLAQLISNAVEIDGKQLSATAETGNASVANATLLGRKGIESAFVAADILDAAYKGEKQFDGKAIEREFIAFYFDSHAARLVLNKATKLQPMS